MKKVILLLILFTAVLYINIFPINIMDANTCGNKF